MTALMRLGSHCDVLTIAVGDAQPIDVRFWQMTSARESLRMPATRRATGNAWGTCAASLSTPTWRFAMLQPSFAAFGWRAD